MKASLDRLPLIAFAAALPAIWLAAEYYHRTTAIEPSGPALAVWAAYDDHAVLRLVLWALAGLFVAAVLPLSASGGDPRELAHDVQRSAARLGWLWSLLAVATLLASIYVKGSYLIEAPGYLMFTASSAIVSLAGSAQPIGILAAGVVSTRHPVLGTLMCGAWFVVLFAYATRFFAAILLLYMIGRWLGGSTPHLLSWVVAAGMAVVLLPIPLMSRSLATGGLIPYWANLKASLNTPGFFQDAAHTIASNLGFGIPLLVKTSQQTSISVHDMIVSINPAPTHVAGWDQIMESMRIHPFIPYSALGEWARWGGPALAGFTLVWGLIIRGCLVSIAQSRSPLKVPFLAAALGVSLVSIVLTTQYNTRSVARMVDIVIVIAIAERLSRPFLVPRSTSPSTAEPGASVPAATPTCSRGAA